MNPPIKLDHADLIAFLVLNEKNHRTGFAQHFVNGNFAMDFNALAICKYEGSPGFYLFYCDNNWNVITDTYHATVEEAIEQTESEYSNTKGEWKFVSKLL